MRAEVLGELDDGGAQPAGAGVDEDLLPGLDLGEVDQGLPGGQRDQRDGCGLVQSERGRLEGDVVLVDGDVLGEGPDAQVAGSGVDLVADLEVRDVGPDLGHDAGDVVAEHERRLVLQELLELAVADHLVQRVDAGRAHPDQDVTAADVGLGYVGGAEAVLAVLLDDECLHVCLLSSEIGLGDGALSSDGFNRSGVGRRV